MPLMARSKDRTFLRAHFTAVTADGVLGIRNNKPIIKNIKPKGIGVNMPITPIKQNALPIMRHKMRIIIYLQFAVIYIFILNR